MSYKPFIQVNVEELSDMYRAGLTTRQIAEKTGISYATVGRRLRAAGMEMRDKGPEHFQQLKDGAWLSHMYSTLKKDSNEIAKMIGCSPRTVVSWLERHGIERKSHGHNLGRKFSAEIRQRMSEGKKGRNTGSDNPNWRGGLVHPDKRLRAGYKTKEWSKAVRERDGHKCVECGATGRLHAHHVKSWKAYPDLRWDVSNGITLCPRCHQKAHGWKFPYWIMTNPARVQDA